MSVTVMVAVCPPGAKSKTLMLSISRPVEHNVNSKVNNDVSLYCHIATTGQETYMALWVHHLHCTQVCPVDYHR